MRPKLLDYGIEILNPIERTNIETIRRVELSRGSSYVKPLDPNRKRLYGDYLEVVRELRNEYGTCTHEDAKRQTGLTGVCLVQLIDMEKDGWEELLVVYHDEAKASGDYDFGGESYTLEVWSHESGEPELIHEGELKETQYKSAYLTVLDAGRSYKLNHTEAGSGSYPYYYYQLSQTHDPAMGERYMSSMSTLAFYQNEVQSLTAETLLTLEQGL